MTVRAWSLIQPFESSADVTIPLLSISIELQCSGGIPQASHCAILQRGRILSCTDKCTPYICDTCPPPFTRIRMSTILKRSSPSSSTGSCTFHRSVSGCTSSRGEPARADSRTIMPSRTQRIQQPMLMPYEISQRIAGRTRPHLPRATHPAPPAPGTLTVELDETAPALDVCDGHRCFLRMNHTRFTLR